jgi:pimeloyl-ACP methyl ester carboxylesterase
MSSGILTAPRVEGRVEVRDGRKLGFAEFGPPDGRPILWMHGTPGARRQIPEAVRIVAEEVGVRFIGIDRPGTGLSSPHLYESILDHTADLEILVDQLRVQEMAVIGLSGGGPYALAAGCAMADRIKVVAVMGWRRRRATTPSAAGWSVSRPASGPCSRPSGHRSASFSARCRNSFGPLEARRSSSMRASRRRETATSSPDRRSRRCS